MLSQERGPMGWETQKKYSSFCEPCHEPALTLPHLRFQQGRDEHHHSPHSEAAWPFPVRQRPGLTAKPLNHAFPAVPPRPGEAEGQEAPGVEVKSTGQGVRLVLSLSDSLEVLCPPCVCFPPPR